MLTRLQIFHCEAAGLLLLGCVNSGLSISQDPCHRMIKKTTHKNRLVPRPLSKCWLLTCPCTLQLTNNHTWCMWSTTNATVCPELRATAHYGYPLHIQHTLQTDNHTLDKYQNNGKWVLTVGDKLWAVKCNLKSFRDALSSAIMDFTEWPIQLHNSYDVCKLIKSTGELTNLLVIKKRTSPRGVEVVSQ